MEFNNTSFYSVVNIDFLEVEFYGEFTPLGKKELSLVGNRHFGFNFYFEQYIRYSFCGLKNKFVLIVLHMILLL